MRVSKNFVHLPCITELSTSVVRFSKSKGISALTEMPFLIEKEPQGCFFTFPKNFHENLNTVMQKQKFNWLKVSLYLEFKAPKLVRVKAYKRVRNGKVEKVRSHYRNVEGRLVVRNELRR